MLLISDKNWIKIKEGIYFVWSILTFFVWTALLAVLMAGIYLIFF